MTNSAEMPTFAISGVAIDTSDFRAHGKGERVRVESYYQGVEFFYRNSKALTSPATN